MPRPERDCQRRSPPRDTLARRPTTRTGSASKQRKRGAPIRCSDCRADPHAPIRGPRPPPALPAARRGRLAAAGLPASTSRRSAVQWEQARTAQFRPASNGTPPGASDAARTDPRPIGASSSKAPPPRPRRAQSRCGELLRRVPVRHPPSLSRSAASSQSPRPVRDAG